MALDIGIEVHVRNRVVIGIEFWVNALPLLGNLDFDLADQLIGDRTVIIGTALCFILIGAGRCSAVGRIIVMLCVVGTAGKLIVVRHITPHIVNEFPLTAGNILIGAVIRNR